MIGSSTLGASAISEMSISEEATYQSKNVKGPPAVVDIEIPVFKYYEVWIDLPKSVEVTDKTPTEVML